MEARTDSPASVRPPSEEVTDAQAHAHVAHAILADPSAPNAAALPHLLGAWRALCRARSGAVRDEDLKEQVAQLQRTTAAGAKPKHDAAALIPALLESVERSPVAPGGPRAATLFAHLRALDRASKGLRVELGLTPPPMLVAMRWSRRALGWGGIVAVGLLLGLRPWQRVEVGQWRGAYYPGKDLRGDPDVRREANVDFDWGKDPPTDSIPSDRFGASFDTCMKLDEDVEAAFQLVSDDGSRLLIDGKQVIDNWGKHDKRARGAKIKLARGTHHVRVEYFEESHGASLSLLASFDKETPPGPIPSSWLSYPGDEIDEGENPCE